MCVCDLCFIEAVVCNLCVCVRQHERLSMLTSLMDESMSDGGDRSGGPQYQGAQHWPGEL